VCHRLVIIFAISRTRTDVTIVPEGQYSTPPFLRVVSMRSCITRTHNLSISHGQMCATNKFGLLARCIEPFIILFSAERKANGALSVDERGISQAATDPSPIHSVNNHGDLDIKLYAHKRFSGSSAQPHARQAVKEVCKQAVPFRRSGKLNSLGMRIRAEPYHSGRPFTSLTINQVSLPEQ
jgi:hypothetical protein